MSKPFISIIIPVYKAEKYLARCLDSIIGQSLREWECILVDDGSPDDSGKICDNYGQSDSRFIVIHKNNGGPGAARNSGIDIAKGEYIIFIDSDDWIGIKHLENLYVSSENCSIDLVCQGLTYYADAPIKIHKWDNKLYYKDEIRSIFSFKGINKMGFSVGKLYKTSIIEEFHLRMDEDIRYGEDAIFLLDYIKHIDSIKTIDKVDYFYFVNNSSLSHITKYDFATSLKCFRVVSNNLDILQKKYALNESEFLENRIWASGYFYRALLSYRNDSKGFIEDLNNIKLITSRFSSSDWYHMDCSFDGCSSSYLKYFLLKHRIYIIWLIIQKIIH